MSPARSNVPSSVETRRATCATSARPHWPISPTPMTVAVCPVTSPPPPPPVPPPLGRDGELEHAVAAATKSRSSRECIRPLPALTYVVPSRHSKVMTSAAGKASKVHRMVLSPQEPLISGGPAEELERRIQEIFKSGFEHVVIDLRGVPTADSAGIRALVRGHTSAQRLNRRFTLVSPNPRVTELLELSLLTRVLEVVDTLVEAKTKTIPWDRVWTGIAVGLVGAGLVGVRVSWPNLGLQEAAAPGVIPGVTNAPEIGRA